MDRGLARSLRKGNGVNHADLHRKLAWRKRLAWHKKLVWHKRLAVRRGPDVRRKLVYMEMDE